jgi:hypothetical protein
MLPHEPDLLAIDDSVLRPTSFGEHLLDMWVGDRSTVPLCVHHSLESEHVHALRSRERGCFLVVQTLWVEKFSQQPMLDR